MYMYVQNSVQVSQEDVYIFHWIRENTELFVVPEEKPEDH